MVFTFLEFFAGGGMARTGLGDQWQCLFANDNDERKAQSYRDNWGDDDLIVADVQDLSSDQLPQTDLAWASFPCQDLSLAGNGHGLGSERSGAFWPFWSLMKEQYAANIGPRAIVLENVVGLLTSNNGSDFQAIAKALVDCDLAFGALVVNADLFLPQSRPRLFIIAVPRETVLDSSVASGGPVEIWHPRSLQLAQQSLPKGLAENWVWWSPPYPEVNRRSLTELIDDDPTGVDWHSPEQTKSLIAMMDDNNLDKLRIAQQSGRPTVGTLYRRTRYGQQRAEVRFDQVAGCLRTPSGGSSRQTIVLVNGDSVKTRLLAPREAARLMGLSEDYSLPANYNAAYHLCGDGVAVPVVRHLAENILQPMLRGELVTDNRICDEHAEYA